jgi:hypothetical protein
VTSNFFKLSATTSTGTGVNGVNEKGVAVRLSGFGLVAPVGTLASFPLLIFGTCPAGDCQLLNSLPPLLLLYCAFG